MRWKVIMAVAVAVVLLVSGLVWWRGGSEEPKYRTVRADRVTVKQDVTFTGRLEAEKSAVLAFESGGTVTEVAVSLGDRVEAGQSLVRLDNRLANLELARALADQDAAEHQKKLAWEAATADWDNTKAQNARLLERRRQAVRDAKDELDQQKAVYIQTESESGDAATTESALAAVAAKESAYHAAQQALLEAQKAAASTNQVKQDAAEAARAAYLATIQRLGGGQGLSSLEATEGLAAVRLEKAVLTAPFSGVVTEADLTEGEYVPAGAGVVQIEAADRLELAADVPETDAAKLLQGNPATITFDAYGSGEQWTAEVASVAPAAEVIEGVPTFEVKLRLISSDVRFRPGLTANITVHTDERANVIAVPRRAVITQDGRQFVEVLELATAPGQEDFLREVDVTTGLLGSDGRIEITSGLQGGEEVVINGGSE